MPHCYGTHVPWDHTVLAEVTFPPLSRQLRLVLDLQPRRDARPS